MIRGGKAVRTRTVAKRRNSECFAIKRETEGGKKVKAHHPAWSIKRGGSRPEKRSQGEG